MASNRDPRRSYRRRKRTTPTSSATRSKRVKASTAPKPTSSSTRSTRRGQGARRVTSDSQRKRQVKTNPVSGPPRGAQGPRTAPVQGPRRKVSGLIGQRPKAKPSPPRAPGRGKGPLSSVASTVAEKTLGPVAKNVGYKAGAKIRKALGGGSPRLDKSGKPIRKAGSSAGKYNTRDANGTVRSRKRVGSKKVGPAKVGPKKVGSIAQAFDKAYSSAKKAGKKSFTFKGKKYTTN